MLNITGHAQHIFKVIRFYLAFILIADINVIAIHRMDRVVEIKGICRVQLDRDQVARVGRVIHLVAVARHQCQAVGAGRIIVIQVPPQVHCLAVVEGMEFFTLVSGKIEPERRDVRLFRTERGAQFVGQAVQYIVDREAVQRILTVAVQRHIDVFHFLHRPQ